MYANWCAIADNVLMRFLDSPADWLVHLWRRLSPWPGGKWLFSFILARAVPYTGTLRAQVLAVAPGYACVALNDRRRVRNHLRSIHALALANLGEFASALSMMSTAPRGLRMIVTQLSIDYLKKARGRLTAEGRSQLPATITTETEQMVFADIRDASGEVVARVAVKWLLRPRA